MRAAADTVQAVILVRKLFGDQQCGLFMEFSFVFRFAFFASHQSGKDNGCNDYCLGKFKVQGSKFKVQGFWVERERGAGLTRFDWFDPV